MLHGKVSLDERNQRILRSGLETKVRGGEFSHARVSSRPVLCLCFNMSTILPRMCPSPTQTRTKSYDNNPWLLPCNHHLYPPHTQITAISESASLQEQQDKQALDELKASLRLVQADLLAVRKSLNTTDGASKASGSSKVVSQCPVPCAQFPMPWCTCICDSKSSSLP